MKLPKRLSDVLKRKAVYLDKLRSKLEKNTIKLQSTLFESLVTELTSKLDVKDGLLQDTPNNYRVISQLDRVYKDFNKTVSNTLVPDITKGIEGIVNVNKTFFSLSLTGTLADKFEKAIEATKKLTDLRLGLEGGQMVRGGFLMSMLQEGSQLDMKQYISKALTSQMSFKDFIEGIREKITGSKEKTGTLERQFQRFTYDVYQQYDRAYSTKLAEELNMEYFIYQGGLVEDSRDFCVAHNDKVFSVKETKDWDKWTPNKGLSNGEFPEGYEIKSKHPEDVPSYLGYPGYDPMTDFGGYNCGHFPGFINTELAKEMRGEKKEVK